MARELDVRGLASAYRRLVLWFGAQLLLFFPAMAQQLAGPGVAGATLGALMLTGSIVTMVALAYYGYRTATALGSDAGWVWGVAMLVPCVNVVTLLLLSAQATRTCKAHGIEVGLFGPRDGFVDSDG